MRNLTLAITCILGLFIGSVSAQTQSEGNGNMGPIVTCSYNGVVEQMPLLICKQSNGDVL